MKSLIAFVITLVSGTVLYVVLFMYVLEKPLTVGITQDYILHKRSYLRSRAGGPVILILAGSNGRFSHSCEVIQKVLGRTCVNLSIAAGNNLQWQIETYQDLIHPGDVLYLPLEYESYSVDSRFSAAEAPFIVRHDHPALLRIYSGEEQLRLLFWFDLRYAISSLGEMALANRGVTRRFSVRTLTPNGDEAGHTRERGRAYQTYVSTLRAVSIPEETWVPKGRKDLAGLLKTASSLHLNIIGGLPTTIDGAHLPPDSLATIQDLYTRYGGSFIKLPNNSVYPRSCFYDSVYHLNEECQRVHSLALAERLKEWSERAPKN